MNSNKRWADMINAQPMFDVLALANKKEKEGNYLARMEIGDTPGFKNNSIDRILVKSSQEPHRYSPSKGEPFLIDVLFAKQWGQFSKDVYDISVAPANFLIMAALAAVTSSGDTVLIPDPGFPTYKLACEFLGLKTLTYSLYPNKSYTFPSIDLSEFSSNSLPKVIIINNPSNPLGIAFDGKQVLEAINSLVQAGVEVIIDETYINLVYDSTDPFIPIDDAIRIRTFSKEHCAPGLRVGYALANHEYSNTISNLISLTISCVPKFIQIAVAEYLSTDESALFLQSVIKEMKQRHELLSNTLPNNAMLTKPNSAFYAMIETGEAEKSYEFFMEKHVATCPGSKFGPAAKSALRISIAGKSETLSKDFKMLLDAYNQWVNN